MENSIKKSKKLAPSKKVFLIASAIVLLLIFAIVYAFSAPYSAPSQFVENQTVTSEETMFFTYEISRYPTKVEISNITEKNISIGFSLEPWNLNFGIVPTGGSMGNRFINLENTADRASKIKLVAYGNIADMVTFSDNDFLISKNAPKPVKITLETKKDTPLGNYSGEIDIIVKKPKYDFAGKLL